jgi:hypothetical protein
METSSIELSLVNTSIGPHCTWYVDQQSTHGGDHFVVPPLFMVGIKISTNDILATNLSEYFLVFTLCSFTICIIYIYTIVVNLLFSLMSIADTSNKVSIFLTV